MQAVKHLLALCLLFIAGYAHAQTCNLQLTGRVVASGTLLPVPGAVVQYNTNKTLLANSAGRFVISGLCHGTLPLTITAPGFSTQHLAVDMHGNDTVMVTLLKGSLQLREVVVTGSPTRNVPLQASSALSDKDVQLSRGSSLAQSLAALPGVTMLQTGPNINKPVLHGMSGARLAIINSGVKQEGQQWGNDHAPEIDPFIAGHLTVVKGAASVMYGADAVAGVVLVQPQPLLYSRAFTGRATFSGVTNGAAGTANVMAEKGFLADSALSIRLYGTGKRGGAARAPVYYLSNTGMAEYNGAVLAGFRRPHYNLELFASTFNGRAGIYTGAQAGSVADLLAAVSRTRPTVPSTPGYTISRPYQSVNHNLLRLKGQYVFDGTGVLNFQYDYQYNLRKEYDYIKRDEDNSYQLMFKLHTHSANLFFQHNPVGNFSGRVGLTGNHQQNSYAGAYLIPFFHSYNLAAYAVEKISLNRLTLEAGLRYDYKDLRAKMRQVPTNNSSPVIRPHFTWGQLTGTLGSTYAIAQGWQAMLTLARGWRPPAANELFINGVHQSNVRYERGNTSLRSEVVTSLNADINKTAGLFRGQFSAWVMNFNNYIYLQPQPQPILTIRGAFPLFTYVQVPALFSGADARVSVNQSGTFYGIAKAAIVRAKNKQSHTYIEYIPGDTFEGTLGINIPPSSGFSSTFAQLGISRTSKALSAPAADLMPPPAGYTLFNAAAGTGFTIGRYNCRASLTLNNIFNKRYRNYLNAYRYFADDTGFGASANLEINF